MRALALGFLALVMACDGAAEIGLQRPVAEPPAVAPPGPGNPSVDLSACDGVRVAASAPSFRRLTPAQHESTLQGLMGSQNLSFDLPAHSGDIITELEVERLHQAVETVVSQGGHLRYLPASCSATGAPDTACAHAFVDALAAAAFRRPLKAEERTWLRGVYGSAVSLGGLASPVTFREALDAVAAVVLQSPQLLYVNEVGVADPALPAGVRRLTAHERATRLSYFLWQTAPDEALRAAADSGKLDTVEGMRQEAERLLADDRARAAVRAFASSWLDLNGNAQLPPLEELPKSAGKFPEDSLSLRKAMRTETEALLEHVVYERQGAFRELLTSRRAYVNQALGKLYGVSGAPTSDSTFAWVDLPATERAGLFTRAAFLTYEANQDHPSPIRRGVFLYRKALCQVLGDPPPDADDTPPKPSSGALTIREQTEVKTAGACQACHGLVNPLGHTLGNYDALGKWQTKDTGELEGTPFSVPVDATAEVRAGDLTGAIAGPFELSERLAQSALAHDCLALKWFEYGYQRTPTSADSCAIARMQQRFRETDDLREVLLSLAAGEPSLYIQEVSP